MRMNKIGLFILFALGISSCEHSGETIIEYQGDYRFVAGIGEFFDCKSRIKYFLADAGISTELEKQYLELAVPNEEDVYAILKGYLKEETQIEGVDPITVFVPTKVISLDPTRGCEKPKRQGN